MFRSSVGVRRFPSRKSRPAPRPAAAGGRGARLGRPLSSPLRPPVCPLTACTTRHTNCRLSDGQPFHCLIVGYNTTRSWRSRARSPWHVAWCVRCVFGAVLCGDGACDGPLPCADPCPCGRGRGLGACRAPEHAPPSRTTRTDTCSTGPDMSWERDVRVHNITMQIILHTHT